MFPPFIRSADDAVAYLDTWIELLGGYRLDGLVIDDLDGGGFATEAFHVELPRQVGDYLLTIALTVDRDLCSTRYKFDLRTTSGDFLWRFDMHPGHETEHGGPCHLHLGPTPNLRVASDAVDLSRVADRLRRTIPFA